MRSIAPSFSTAFGLFGAFLAMTPAHAVTVSGTYYDDVVQVTCNNTTTCEVPFPLSTAIAGKFLNVRFLSCGMQAPGVLNLSTIGIADAASASALSANYRRAQWLGAPSASRVSGQVDFRQELQMKVSGGPPRHIIVTLSAATSGSWSVGCSITGEIATE